MGIGLKHIKCSPIPEGKGFPKSIAKENVAIFMQKAGCLAKQKPAQQKNTLYVLFPALIASTG